MKSVGGYLAPETSVNSVNSVGDYLRGWSGYGRMPYPPMKTPTDCTDVQIYTEPSAEKSLPQILQIYTEPFSKKVLCALRILWEFLYTNLKAIEVLG